jgi:rRNA small subunit methyltransferase G
MPPQRAALTAVLEEAHDFGFLGPGPVGPAIDHALGFLPLLRPAARILDLGSGGGVPGLVLATVLPLTSFTLFDASERRGDALQRWITRLGLHDRVDVVVDRSERAARQPAHRGRYDAVVSRGFGPPSATAEAAAPFLRVEPPTPGPDRWPPAGLALVGLAVDKVRPGYRSFRQVTPCDGRFPRRSGRPPLFDLVSRGTTLDPSR